MDDMSIPGRLISGTSLWQGFARWPISGLQQNVWAEAERRNEESGGIRAERHPTIEPTKECRFG